LLTTVSAAMRAKITHERAAAVPKSLYWKAGAEEVEGEGLGGVVGPGLGAGEHVGLGEELHVADQGEGHGEEDDRPQQGQVM
jgi:hypothetical protein